MRGGISESITLFFLIKGGYFLYQISLIVTALPSKKLGGNKK